jgi:hypothetical protein
MTLGVFFTGQSFAQAPAEPPKKLTLAEQYGKLLDITAGVMTKLREVCKTDECAALSTEGLALTTEARPKVAKDWAGYEQDMASFHARHASVMRRTIAVLQANRPTTTSERMKFSGPLPDADVFRKARLKNAYFDEYRCGLCYDVLEQTAEICALYAFVSPEAALICLAVSGLQFGGCLNGYCIN